jgi:hypothetical protein
MPSWLLGFVNGHTAPIVGSERQGASEPCNPLTSTAGRIGKDDARGSRLTRQAQRLRLE